MSDCNWTICKWGIQCAHVYVYAYSSGIVEQEIGKYLWFIMEEAA